MAAIIGFVDASTSLSNSGKEGSMGGFPNSEMSAPAIKVRPSQIKTIAKEASFCACANAA